MNLDQALKKWNGGVQRGAASRFAAALGVLPSTVSMWRKGSRPSEEMVPKIARELGVTPAEVEAMFPARAAGLDQRLADLERQVRLLTSVVNDLQGSELYVKGQKVRGGKREP